MKMIASRTLAASPGSVWKMLKKEGTLVITKDGKPRGILMPTSDATLIEDVQDQVRARAWRAVREIQRRAAQRAKPFTQAEINAEIAAVRRERKLKK